MMNSMIKKTLLASSVALALGAPAANATLVTALFGANSWTTQSANFTMLSGAGLTVGGTNDVAMNWDGNGYNNSTDYTGLSSASNVTASSTTTFFGYTWTAHNIQVFTPGSYSFNTAVPGGNGETGFLNVVVPVNQLGMHMLFDWNGNNNIDVFVNAAGSSVFGSGIGRSTSFDATNATFHCDTGALGTKNCLWDGAKLGPDGKPAGSKVWMLSSVDGNGDGIMGNPMNAGGPFAGFNANFNATMTAVTVPVPAAAWLFGSGLVGLVGIARRKKSS